jgi:Holliday junction resolvase RusA-like endonuclease
MTVVTTRPAAWTPVPNGIWGALRSFIEPYVGAAFTIPGDPVPKERPRVEGRRARTPKKTLDAEKRVRAAFKDELPDWEPEPDLTYGALIEFRTRSGSLVDIDNATKLVMDALNKTFWLDDIQVGNVFLHIVRGGSEPCTQVWLFAVEPNGTKLTRVCECGTRYRSEKKICAACEKRRAVVNALLADDDSAVEAAQALDRDRRRVFSYVTARSIGTNTSPSVKAIADHTGLTTTRTDAVLMTLISDGYMTRKGTTLKIVKPLGVAA